MRRGDHLPGTNRLEGKVAASAYQGGSVEYEIGLRGKTLRAYISNPKGRALFNRGDEVTVIFGPKDVGWLAQETP